ncbi:MAG: PilC/PilY family type IV pilus protein [Woeseia sp.]
MKTEFSSSVTAPRRLRKAVHVLAAAAWMLLAGAPAHAEVAQSPLYLGGGNVPGNLTLVPSVEYPTILSVANLGRYDSDNSYAGYFDPNKCYNYHYSNTESQRHFYPVGQAVARQCAGQWSGNFMNWAATQTIDPFRSVLTGGLRVVDNPGETWLEKARHTGQDGTGLYPNRRLPDSGNDTLTVAGATPFSTTSWMRMRIEGLGNKMRFRLEGDDVNDDVSPYNPASSVDDDDAYEVSIRVKVCVSPMLEANCRYYPTGHKPEGLIQQYSDELRIGVFGYLNDDSTQRDGGVLRARQKFVGQTAIVPDVGEQANPHREWDPDTGVLFRNPDPADASATAGALDVSIQDSGAINYLNKFGQLTNNSHKSIDPVSELYYTALRYLKNQGNVPQYSNVPGNTGVNRARAADGFPVITDWNDPIQYACQKNVVLGIGDIYTHRDKNLPGSTRSNDEPAMPAAVAADNTVNVATETARVATLEGFGINTPFTGRENSAYIAGLAWHANTTDMRDDLPGTQTASLHWVDVLEAQSLENPDRNQYYLAAKYGGFRVPDDFEPATHTGPLPLDWWHSNGEILTSFGPRASPAGRTFPRPDNYYLAGSANQMVESLTKAFARISTELRSSASSVAANSTRLGSDTAVFQAQFDSTRWSGELQAFRINADSSIDTTPSWSAADKLDARTEFSLINRKIFTNSPPSAVGDGSLVSTSGVEFKWPSLSTEQQDELRTDVGGGPLLSNAVGQARLEFLRGSRLLEQPLGPFRKRDSRLGDIVNSDPQFMHQQDFGYTLLEQSQAFFGSGIGLAYKAFRESASYQGRPPMVVVAGNDGMLHGFNASLTAAGGDEIFAYVPDNVFENLHELTLPEYAHRFFVDGSPRVADAYFNGGWGTIAVGSTGAGGRSVFALDITNPASMTSSSVLWEFTHPDMGYTIGQPAVAPLPNGEFGVVVTSGYQTGATSGTIWILDPADGSIIHSFSVTGSGDLGAPLVVDINSDRVADRIYVGDTDGNLWRFDMPGSNLSNWKPPNGLRNGNNPKPLFVARDDDGVRQAITAPLSSAFNDKGLHTVFFGTGSFYRVDDNVVPPDPDIDSFYGIVDRGVEIPGRGELLEQSILAETTVAGTRLRGVTANEIQSSHKGWYLDLEWSSAFGGPGPAGERVVSRATVRGDRVIFATVIPNPDPCAFGGDSWVMELNTFNGGRLSYAVFDTNGDGLFDESDWITITDENGDEVKVPPSAIAPDINIVKTPAIIAGFGPNQDEVKVMSGSSGQMIRISERGAVGIGRQSWRQIK